MTFRHSLIALAPLAAALAVAGMGRADAAERRRCLGKEEQRAAVAANQAVPLTTAIQAARERTGGEVVRARLCEDDSGLVYVLTVLPRDGKVVRVPVHAASGTVVGAP
jgi:uncharacterized membrane protein YkoI